MQQLSKRTTPRVTITETMPPDEYHRRRTKPVQEEPFEKKIQKQVEQVVLRYLRNFYEDRLFKKDRPTGSESLNDSLSHQ